MVASIDKLSLESVEKVMAATVKLSELVADVLVKFRLGFVVFK